jgi:hemerythrin HHE cation binding domain-containing protein
MEAVSPEPAHDLENLRLRRAELRDSMRALEQALAAPAPGRVDLWAERVHVALVELSADFRQHIDITEGPDGLYPGLLTTAPRLSNAVTGLIREHDQITALIDDLLTCLAAPVGTDDLDSARDLGTALLSRLIRHRQRGADLVYEAYATDIGGET